MSLVKTVLYKMGLLGLATSARNGTWRHLRGGYSPHRFWKSWGGAFAEEKYQREIHAGQEWLLSELRAAGPASILEVGCGFGRNLEYLARNLGITPDAGPEGRGERRARLTGIDISEPMLKRGRKELPGACGLACGDILKLPFPDGAFDLVFTHGVLMHVPPRDLQGALAEIRRVARSAILLVEETRWKGIDGAGAAAVNGYTFLHSYPEALRKAGYSVLETAQTGGSVNLAFYRCRPR